MKTTMQHTLAQGMRDLHTWGGLFFGWVLFIVFLTGTFSVFEPEITYWMKPEVRIEAVSDAEALKAAESNLHRLAPSADAWFIRLPNERTPMLKISWKKGNQTFHKYIDPVTQAVIKERPSEGGEFFSNFHYELHSERAGTWLVSLASLVMLGALISGILIRKSVIKDFVCLKFRKNWLNVHYMTGVLTLPFVILITYSGLVMTFMNIMPVSQGLFYKNQGALWAETLKSVERPKTNERRRLYSLTALLPNAEKELGAGKIAFVQVKNPGDRNSVINFMRRVDDRMLAIADRATFDGVSGEWLVSQTKWNQQITFVRSLVGLHIGKFGGYKMAWLYFGLGLIGCVMIATGLIFFTVKRRLRYEREGDLWRGLFRIADALNVGVIAGSMVASISYFWINRLMPLGLKERAESEITVLFLIWLLMLVHAFYRPKEKAWVEQLRLAALLCMGLPLLNALTTSVGLQMTLLRGEWMTAGVDLTAAALGIILGTIAVKVQKNWYKTPSGIHYVNG